MLSFLMWSSCRTSKPRADSGLKGLGPPPEPAVLEPSAQEALGLLGSLQATVRQPAGVSRGCAALSGFVTCKMEPTVANVYQDSLCAGN